MVNMLPIFSVQENLNWPLVEILMETKSRQPHANAIKKAADASGKMNRIKRANAKNGSADIQMENLSKRLASNTLYKFSSTNLDHSIDRQSVLARSGDQSQSASLSKAYLFDVFDLNVKTFFGRIWRCPQ